MSTGLDDSDEEERVVERAADPDPLADSDDDEDDDITRPNIAPLGGAPTVEDGAVASDDDSFDEPLLDSDDDTSDASDASDDDDESGGEEGEEGSDDDVAEKNEADSSKEKKKKRKSGKSKKEKKKKEKKKKEKKKDKKKKRSREDDFNTKVKRKVSSLFLDEAEVASDDDEEEEDMYEEEEEILGEDELEAIERVNLRHEEARKRMKQDSKTLAQEYENKYRYHSRMESSLLRAADGSVGVYNQKSVSQQSLLPSVRDPAIYSVRCKPGEERQLVRSILMKQFSAKMAGEALKLKSAFCTGAKGYIYVEALAEPLAKEALSGLRGIFWSSKDDVPAFSKVPINQMTSLLNVKVTKRPLKNNQFVRIKRGPLKGDLAKVVYVYEGSSKAVIQAVPRPDYTKEKSTKLAGVVARPPQALFNAEEASANEHDVQRRRMPMLNETMHFWKNEFYRNGFLMKDVLTSSYITDENVKVTVEEVQMFREKKVKGFEDRDDFDKQSDMSNATSLAEELMDVDASVEDQSTSVPYILGDSVQVVSGELKGILGKVVGVDETNKLVRVAPQHESMTAELVLEVDMLMKHIQPGAHVKVTEGAFLGQTGKVVCITETDGSLVAAILTDGVNTEISVNVAHLQTTNEVTVGLSNLAGFELYDLVVLNQNESAVVTYVGQAALTVINHQEITKRVQPMDLKGKRNGQSMRSTAFDASHNILNCGDVVKVMDSAHKNKTGTIKHIFKSVLWLHSTSHLKNSGIFVVRARLCVLSGNKNKIQGGLGYMGSVSPSYTPSGPSASSGSSQGTMGRAGGRGGMQQQKDPMIGKTVMILKGGFKGFLAHVNDATETHYQVEVLAKLKKISIEKERTRLAGDNFGSLNADGQRPTQDVNQAILLSQATPFMQGATPMHAGSATPMYTGSETPMHGTPRGNRTPGGHDEDAFNPWNVSGALPQSSVAEAPSAAGGESARSAYSAASSWNMTPMNDSYADDTASMASGAVGGRGGTGAEISHMDWPRDTVVVDRYGRLSVIQSKVAKDGTLQVIALVDGQLRGAPNKIHYEDVVLADPKAGDSILVVAGKHQGFQGTIKKILGVDVFVHENPRNYRSQYLVWKFNESG